MKPRHGCHTPRIVKRCAIFFALNVTDFVDTTHGDADSVLRARFSCAIRIASVLRKIAPRCGSRPKASAMKPEGDANDKGHSPQQGRTVHGPQTRGTLRHSRNKFHTARKRRFSACQGRERCQGGHAAVANRAPWLCWRLRFAEGFCPVGPRIGIRASPP